MTRRAAVLALVILACGPERGEDPSEEGLRYARVTCEAIEDCGCQERFSSPGECQATLSARFDEALADGLVLDERCFDRTLEHPTLNSCGPQGEFGTDEWCTVFQGRGRGEPCRLHNELPLLLATGCDEGLECSQGVCVEAEGSLQPVPRTEGDACDPRDGASCRDPNLYCGHNGLCRRKKGQGAWCNEAWSCGTVRDLLYCKGEHLQGETGVCSELEPLGAPCDPRDYFPCFDGWCDPAVQACTPWDEAPRVCLASNHPPAGPWPPR